ncbi:hypothetical protein GGF50DRAFT_124292 [Schizophyllum commune]
MPPPCRWPTAAPLASSLMILVPAVPSLRPLEDAHSLAEVRGGPTSRRPPNNHEANDAYLRRQLRIPPQTRADLWALLDSPPHVRPLPTLETLAKLAIHGVALQKRDRFMGCTYAEVCDEIAKRFPYFNSSEAGSWRNSVRHVLSKKTAFHRSEGPNPGRYWLDFSQGEGDRVPRKRGSGSSSSDFDYDSDAY